MALPTSQSLLNRSIKHYSIYTEPNVMPNAEYLPLFTSSVNPIHDPGRSTRRILLGQSLYWQDQEPLNIALAKRVIQQFSIEYYLPHPKESYIVDGVQYIDTNLIAEDFLMQELASDPHVRYHVYLYCSSTALNLKNDSRLTFTALKPADAPEFLLETYELLERVGIPIIDLPAMK